MRGAEGGLGNFLGSLRIRGPCSLVWNDRSYLEEAVDKVYLPSHTDTEDGKNGRERKSAWTRRVSTDWAGA